MPAIRVEKTKALQNGHTVIARDLTGDAVLFVGTRPLTEAQAEGRRIVREGLADVLAWLGEPVEMPTGQQVYAHLRGIPRSGGGPILPTSTRAFPGVNRAQYFKPVPIDWSAGFGSSVLDPTTVTMPETMTLTAQRFGVRDQLPPIEHLPVGEMVALIRGAIERAYACAAEGLRQEGMVADITDGYPMPELSVELRLKAWPAVPGVTTPDRDDR